MRKPRRVGRAYKGHARLVSAMSDLHDELTDIQGVGDATADKVLEIVGEYDTGDTDPLLAKAIDAAHEGDNRDAAMYLRRAEGGE